MVRIVLNIVFMSFAVTKNIDVLILHVSMYCHLPRDCICSFTHWSWLNALDGKAKFAIVITRRDVSDHVYEFTGILSCQGRIGSY